MLFEGSNHVQNFHINNSTNRNAIKLMNIQKIFNSCSKVKIIIFFTSKAQACCSILQLFINVLDIAMPLNILNESVISDLYELCTSNKIAKIVCIY